ncbi:hypothetical protein ACVBGC_17565 [Burkholderia stagnalis]
MTRFKGHIAILCSITFLLACSANHSLSGEQVGISERPTSGTEADAFLKKIAALIFHNDLRDSKYFSTLFNIKLFGGELESGQGSMVNNCGLAQMGSMQKWTGRRYRYESAPKYLVSQGAASDSICGNPYIIEMKNNHPISSTATLQIKTDQLCISENDIKRYFPDAIYRDYNQGFTATEESNGVENNIKLIIDSTRLPEICVYRFQFEQKY